MNTDENLLLKRLEKLEQKVELISQIIGLQDEKKAEAKPIEKPVTKPVEKNLDLPKINEVKTASVNLLPILAVICFGLAGIFMVNLAIDSGWLTEDKQWGLLSIFGISLVSVGLFFKKIDNNYRSYASASGVIVLYLAAYSSSLFFHLFDPKFFSSSRWSDFIIVFLSVSHSSDGILCGDLYYRNLYFSSTTS